MAKRLSVVISQGQSHNPQKRQLEEELCAALMMEPGIDLAIIPNLYDLKPDGTGILALQGIGGDVVVLSWLFERAARWTLSRGGIEGQEGQCLINSIAEDDDEDEDEDDGEGDDAVAEEKPRVIDTKTLPARKIYCIELAAHKEVATFLDEVRRIGKDTTTQVVQLGGLDDWVKGSPSASAMERFENPTNDTAVGNVAPANGQNSSGNANGSSNGNGSPLAAPESIEPFRIEETADRRWYPVIDFSRCTNCMECIDFCLFGVYGVDGVETILVEQPDNCRKGCPACSRVCPENAIIFPQHKAPGIAGAPGEVANLKIDLSRLFGAPDAVEMAARERDEQLLLAGRDAVGMSVGVPKRQDNADTATADRDELDDLIDGLDELDI